VTSTTIRTAAEITPEWLENALASGPDPQCSIDTVTTDMERELPVSKVARLVASYRENPKKLPDSFFLKLSKPDVNVGVAEIAFYNAVSEPADTIPHCYRAEADETSHSSYLLLEDLTDTHFQTEQETAPDREVSLEAVGTLARFHARWWNEPQLGVSVGKVFDGPWLDAFAAELSVSVDEFKATHQLPRDHVGARDLMVENSEMIWGRLTTRRGLTLTNGDLHWWNFMFPKNAERNSVRILDWQLWHVDLGVRDLAFLLAFGGFAEPRPMLELELVTHYYNCLTTNGVSIGWEALWTDYRISAIRNLNLPIIFWKQGKHSSTVETALRRALASYVRLGCEELLTSRVS